MRAPLRLNPSARASIIRLLEAAKAWDGRPDADIIDVACAIDEWGWLHRPCGNGFQSDHTVSVAMRAVRLGLRGSAGARAVCPRRFLATAKS